MSKIEQVHPSLGKKLFSLHNEKLACGHQKNNFQFVSIIFFYFYKKTLGDFYMLIIYQQLSTKCPKNKIQIIVVKYVII